MLLRPLSLAPAPSRSARHCAHLLASAPVVLLIVTPLLAQAHLQAGGRVVRTVGADSVAVAHARVLLHRIGRSAQGPIDSVTTDAAGRFRFRFTPDTSAVFLASSRFQGIEYFSPAVRQASATPDTTLRIVVSDTSSAAP